jgi:hypothetical protein
MRGMPRYRSAGQKMGARQDKGGLSPQGVSQGVFFLSFSWKKEIPWFTLIISFGMLKSFQDEKDIVFNFSGFFFYFYKPWLLFQSSG